MDRLESGKGDTDKLVKQVNSSIGAVEQVLDTILSDDSLAPDLRQRAAEIRTRTKAASEIDDLRQELEEVKKSRNTQEVPQYQADELSPLEKTVHTMIAKSGLKIEDFNWTEANALYQTGGDDGVIGYFTEKIVEAKTEAQAASRRQARKTDAGKTPSPAGQARTPEQKLGDDSVDLDERVRILRELMAGRG